MASAVFPQEILEIFVDEFGIPYTDPNHPDYQSVSLRTTLCCLSLSHRNLRPSCRCYLWHTLALNSGVPSSGEPLLAFQNVFKVLSSEHGPEPLVKRLRLQWGRKLISGSLKLTGTTTEDHINSQAAMYLMFVPKILGTLRHLDALHLEGDKWYVSGTPAEACLMPPTFECIRENLLREVNVKNISLPPAFLALLPYSLKILVLADVTSNIWGHFGALEAPSHDSEAVAPETFHLKVSQKWHKTISHKPASFFSNLTNLDVYIIKRRANDEIDTDSDTFRLVHQRLIGRSPSLQHLTVRYRDIDPQVYEMWSRDLPLMLDDARLPSLVGTLKLELGFHHPLSSRHPPSFEAFACAYLDHQRLSAYISRFELGIVCTGSWGNHLASCDWGSVDARLSDATRFPNLNSVRLTLVNRFLREGNRLASWGSGSGNYQQQVQMMTREIEDTFMGTHTRGAVVTVALSSDE
ncbi:hypothetical protein BKA70DRAFT_1283258 [Coprinopsis sp. MPI-PUGE-AT-0042]|nr:hypothetical protein BKA70DRAFT_1283258 [Coprinopsis sp. MPI-PUGE-AT-0042]